MNSSSFENLCYRLFQVAGRGKFWKYNDIPSDIKRHLKLPQTDVGIDILQFHLDEFTPICCKYQSKQHLKYREISTFLATSFARKEFNEALLMTNCRTFSKHINHPRLRIINGKMMDTLTYEFMDKL